MPVKLHKEKDPKTKKYKYYFRWGKHGKKYYFNKNSMRSIKIAYNRSARQGRAIKASQLRR